MDGASYEIDPSKKSAGTLRKALTEFVVHGRRVKADRSASVRDQKRPVPRTGPSSAAVREWAAAQGVAGSGGTRDRWSRGSSGWTAPKFLPGRSVRYSGQSHVLVAVGSPVEYFWLRKDDVTDAE